MKVLLTQRRFKEIESANNPISILDLAPYIRTLGHEVECFYLDRLPNNKYDIAGLSILNYDKQTLKDALYLRNRFKDSRIVVGGKGARSFNREEAAFLKDKGVEVWPESGEEYFSGSKEIDFENYPPWDIRDMNTLRVRNEAIMSARGCPYSCHFCHNTEKSISFFTARRTVDNIDLLFKKGIRRVFFADDIFTLSLQHMLSIYDECKRQGVSIERRNLFFTHINHINEESVRVMILFQPVSVSIGIESGDNGMLKAMGKPFTAEIAYEKLKALSRHIPVNGLFLIGFPGETRESLNNTVWFVKSIRDFLRDVWVSFYQPVPNTVGFYMAKEHGRIIDTTQNNTRIGYVDRNLTKDDLLKCKYRILASFDRMDDLRLPSDITLSLERLKYGLSRVVATVKEMCDGMKISALIRETITTTIWSGLGKSVGFLVPFFIAVWFGVSGATDVFFFAYGIVIFLTSIFVNSIENTIVPFIAQIRLRGEGEVGAFVGKMLAWGVVGLSMAAVVFFAAARPILGLITRFSSDQLNLLMRIFVEIAPLLVLLAASSVLNGTLNAYKIFAVPAIVPAFRALVILSVIFFLKSRLGVHAVCLGYVVGEVFRLTVLWRVILSRKILRIRLSLELDDETIGFLKTLSYLIAAVAALGLNPIIDKIMASWMREGSVSVLEYADRLYLIPVSLLAGGFTVTTLSRWSTGYYENGGNAKFFRDRVFKAAKILVPVSLTVTLILSIFSKSLVGILYGYGEFPKAKLDEVRTVWLAYLAGFVPYTLTQLFTVERLVRKKTQAPMKVAFAMNGLNIVLNLILMKAIGLPGIALATSITYVVAAVMYWVL